MFILIFLVSYAKRIILNVRADITIIQSHGVVLKMFWKSLMQFPIKEDINTNVSILKTILQLL